VSSDTALLHELVDLFGDANKITISPRELRDAVTSYPGMTAGWLINHCQVIIPELLRHGIHFQFAPGPVVVLSATSAYSNGEHKRMDDFAAALAYVNGDHWIR
jgi:hypothetical protein